MDLDTLRRGVCIANRPGRHHNPPTGSFKLRSVLGYLLTAQVPDQDGSTE